MSQPDISPRRHSQSGLNLFYKPPEMRASTKRPRERSPSPALSTNTIDDGDHLESEGPLLSFSDLIRPLSATPSPEPSLHFGTPPRRTGSTDIAKSISSDYGTNLPPGLPPSGSEDGEELVDDARVAEMRETVLAWGLFTNGIGIEQNHGGRERQLAMMVMALTHPARPTASQIAAQAEHIRSLLAERKMMIRQLEDLSEFRHADRLGFERTAQALNARISKNIKWDRGLTTTKEVVYQDERSRHAELHAQNEKLSSENTRLEHEIQEARREIAALKQSIEELRVNLLIRPHALPTSLQGALHEPVIPPTPNPRGRPRKYPISSPTTNLVFQAPTHSNPGAQLPASSTSILNGNLPPSGSAHPPPEKRMRSTQPDARAELLLAAARRVGKDRVLTVLDGPECNQPGNEEHKPSTEDTLAPSQQGANPLLPQHSPTRAPPPESSSNNGTEISGVTHRGRPPRASISFPTIAHHQFTQFLVDEGGKSYPNGRGRSSKLRPTKSAQETSRRTLESSTSRSPRRVHAQEVVVAFTGDPQVDAQACLASFVAQYPGIRPAPAWSTAKADARSDLDHVQELQSATISIATNIANSGAAETVLVTPDRPVGDARSKGLEHLLTAARTVLRARSRSASPTPTGQLTSNSALASPHHISSRSRYSPSHARHSTNSARRHSSPLVQTEDSDTEPEEPESPSSRRRVYSALDVLADQAAAVRTSSPDPPTDLSSSSPDLYERLLRQELASFPVTPESNTTLQAPVNLRSSSLSPTIIIPTSDVPQFSSSSTSPSAFGMSDNRARKSPKESHEPVDHGIPELGQDVKGTKYGELTSVMHNALEARTSSRDWSSGGNLAPSISAETIPGLHTPPRSEKSRGKQRA